MDYTMIIVFIAYVLFCASLVFLPIKRKKVVEEAGQCIFGFPKKRILFYVLGDIAALILISLIFFIRYSILVTVVLCGCGVLGSWIIAGEASLGSLYGLYENGIIAAGKFIPYGDIVTFPVLNLPASDRINHPDNVLVVASRKYGNVEIVFDSADLCNQAIEHLTKMGIIK